MLLIIARWIVIAFGLFFLLTGCIMLFRPEKARKILRKAGSSRIINYSEISLRMVPATALILYSDFSKFSFLFFITGWFMLATSFILFFVPRKIHHNYSLRCAEIIKPLYFQFISAFSFVIGSVLIYSVY